jgi:hypothetical protein
MTSLSDKSGQGSALDFCNSRRIEDETELRMQLH